MAEIFLCDDFEFAALGGCWRGNNGLCSNTKRKNCPYFKEKNMEKQDKPRLADVLGVDEDEEWESCSAVCRIHNGFREIKRAQGWEKADNERFLTTLINHPGYIKRLPYQRLTEPEIAIMRATGAKWVSRDDDPDNDDYVDLWSEKPEKFEDTYGCGRVDALSSVKAELFPSVNPGDCVEAKEGG